LLIFPHGENRFPADIYAILNILYSFDYLRTLLLIYSFLNEEREKEYDFELFKNPKAWIRVWYL